MLWRRHLPRDDHGDGRHRAAASRVVATSLVIVRRRLRYELVVRGPPHRLRGDRARAGSTRSRPATSSCSSTTAARLLARALRRDARGARRASASSSRSPTRRATGCASPRSSPRAPGVVSLRITGPRLERLRAHAGPVLPLALPHPPRRWWTAHPFSLSEAPDGRSLRITVKALGDFTGRHRRARRPARASSPRGRSASSPTPPAAARRCCWSPAASASRRSARCSRSCAATSSSSTASLARERRRLPRRARGARARARRRACTSSSATTRRRRGGGCSRPSTCASSSRTSPSATSTSAGRPAMADVRSTQNVRAGRRPAPPHPRRTLRPLTERRHHAQDAHSIARRRGARGPDRQRRRRASRRREGDARRRRSSRGSVTGTDRRGRPLGHRRRSIVTVKTTTTVRTARRR